MLTPKIVEIEIQQKLAKRAGNAGLVLPEAALKGLRDYFELLRKWNEKVSLTALPVAEVGDEAIDRLIVEPCLAAGYLPSHESIVVDIGSGGGSPAIPIKIFAPAISLVMVESKTRKAAFLREVVRQLALNETKVETSRFEDLLDRPELHGFADVVTLRAVRVDGEALASVWPLLKPQGALFLFTSRLGPAFVPSTGTFNTSTYELMPEIGSWLQILTRKR